MFIFQFLNDKIFNCVLFDIIISFLQNKRIQIPYIPHPRSMWKSGNDDFFNKNYRVEAFDSTAVVLTGGSVSGPSMLTLTSNAL